MKTDAPPANADADAADADAAPASDADIALRVRDLHVVYDTSAGTVAAVSGVSFDLRRGERLALVGESGSGKSTMATALMRMTRPPGRIVSGSIMLSGRDVLQLSEDEMRAARLAEIALVPQGAMNSLNPVTKVGRQITDGILDHVDDRLRRNGDASSDAADGAAVSGVGLSRRPSRSWLRQRVAELLTNVGLSPSVAGMFPHELSGGMKQRAVLAIATSLSPRVIVADEPTSALDVVVQRQIMQTLGQVQSGLNAAVILVGHDMGLVAQFADTIGVMYAGKLVELGPVEAVFESPRHPYTQLLIESLPTFTEKRDFVGIPGMPPRLIDLPTGCSFYPRCPQRMEVCSNTDPYDVALGDQWRASCHLLTE